VSVARRQAQLDVAPTVLWELLGDPNRYPEWWPRILEVQCDEIAEGCAYKHVSRGPVGTAEETILIERLQDCREVKIRCLDTGTYMRWVLVPVQEVAGWAAQSGPAGECTRLLGGSAPQTATFG
jgi:hypothetical protein